MPFTSKTDHPLDWTDRELKYLIGQGLPMLYLYKAMGYTGRVPTESFKKRVAALKGEG